MKITDQTEHDAQAHNADLRNRSGDSSDFPPDKQAKVNETAAETPFVSSNETDSDDDVNSVEYVKSHPVINNDCDILWKFQS